MPDIEEYEKLCMETYTLSFKNQANRAGKQVQN